MQTETQKMYFGEHANLLANPANAIGDRVERRYNCLEEIFGQCTHFHYPRPNQLLNERICSCLLCRDTLWQV